MLTVAIDRNQYTTSRRTNGDRHPTGQLQPTRLVVLLPATVDAMIERRQGEVNADGGHEQCGRHASVGCSPITHTVRAPTAGPTMIETL